MMGAPVWLRRFLADEDGQDLVEYALLAGIIGIAGYLVLPVIGPKMGNAYLQWGGQVYNAWTPADPVP